MPRWLEKEWLLTLCDDRFSEELICDIVEEQSRILTTNVFPESREIIEVRLDGLVLCFEYSSGVGVLEVFQEIFYNQRRLVTDWAHIDYLVDVGSHLGLFTIFANRMRPSLHGLCIEPNPYVFELLRRNLESNRIHSVCPINCAISDFEGEANFTVARDIPAISGLGATSINRVWMKSDFLETVKVNYTTLDSIFRDLAPLPQGILLKVDVEGAEVSVLKGGAKLVKSSRQINIECHGANEFLESKKILENNGFEVRIIEEEDFKYYREIVANMR
jgi:FkbM family methyltransferase